MRKIPTPNFREMTKTNDVRVYEDLKLEFHVDTENLTCTFYKGKRGKPSWNYRFKTLERLEEKITSEITMAEQAIKEKAELKKAKSKIQEAIKVGDIFCYSWGWEQTNINFYQIISRKGKSTAVIRPINLESVNDTSWGSDEVIPCPDSFMGNDEETVRLNGTSFKRSCGYAFKLDDLKRPHHRSWYA
jgi:hypothetical protein